MTPRKKSNSLKTQIVLSLFSAIIGGLISLGIVQLTRRQQTETELQKSQAEAATAAGTRLELRLQRIETTIEDAHRRIDAIKLDPANSTTKGVDYVADQETVAPDIHQVMVGIQDGTGAGVGHNSHNVLRSLSVYVPSRATPR